MDFYLTDIASGDRLRIPLLPDRLNIKSGAMTVAFNVIETGEVKIPRGTMLTGYSWNSVFPGESMSEYSFVYDWQRPTDIVSKLEHWKEQNKTLRFMATEISINADVFIETFNYEYFGVGHCSYTLGLTTRRKLTIQTVQAPTPPNDPDPEEEDPEEEEKQYGTVKTNGSNLNVRRKASTSSKILGKLKNGSKVEILGKSGNWYIIPYSSGDNGKAYVYASYVKIGSGSSNPSNPPSSSKPPSSGSNPSSYTVKSGDSLYSIAKAKLGIGTRYTEIYNLNKSAIDARNAGKNCSKYTIYAGMTLKLPAK